MPEPYTNQEVIQKMERYCAYQERCYAEVIQKMRAMAVSSDRIDEIMVHLIDHRYLNEERFACSFARGKHRIKNWGKVRIINELKARNISQTNINTALKEISWEEYEHTFNALAERSWGAITEKNTTKKKKKFFDYLLRKGYETNLIYDKMDTLIRQSNF